MVRPAGPLEIQNELGGVVTPLTPAETFLPHANN